jgi:ABC-type transport system involved in multi-copper enzyme maturation permease subunit
LDLLGCVFVTDFITMLKTIIFNDIRQNILSLRLQIIFIIMLLVFIVGTIAYIFQYKAKVDEYSIFFNRSKDEMIKQSERNITSVAVDKRDYIFSPVQNEFIDDAKSQYIPNTVTYNAYNVFSYSISRKSANPYLNPTQELNWSFIVTIILSFTILLLAYDTISGEREMHTLTLILSTGVSRSVLLAGKYISIISTAFLMTFPGLIFSLLILITSGIVNFNVTLLFEICMFIGSLVLFIACIAALGLFCSVVSRSSNVSLLVSLTLWSVFLIFSPNLAIFSARHLFKIKDSENIQMEIKTTQDAINKDAPEGSWSMNSSNPFYPKHELRAKNQTKLMNAEKKIRDEWYNSQFRQFEKASLFTVISPISLFGSVNESLIGIGYPRFRKNWEDIHTYQNQFLTWFKVIDSKDQKSPHWYNPYEVCSTSLEKIKFENIPLYTESKMTLPQRLTKAFPGIAMLLTYSFLLFGITVILFNRYDVR